MPVDIRPLDAPLGAEVCGLDLTRPLDDSTVAALFDALDARILVGTVRSVVVREGISAEGHATMRKFGESDD